MIKKVIMAIRLAKRMKTPYRRWHNERRKHCATAAVKKRLTQTTRLCPADLVSRGKISLGTNQERGPHDQPYATTNAHIAITRRTATFLGSISP